MKLTVNDLYAMNPPDGSNPLKETYEAGLPFKVSMTIKRLTDDVTKELGIVDPERVKLVTEYGKPKKDAKGKVVPNMYITPILGAKNFKEWDEKITEFGNTFVEVTYSPIDLDKLADDMGDKIVKGDFVSIVDQLNKIHEREAEEAKKPKEKEVTQ